jgi:hypothetical protein
MTTIGSKQLRVNQTFVRAAQEIGFFSTTASIDTIELFFRRAPSGLRTRLEAALGRRIRIQECLDATGYKQGVRAIINRANRRVLMLASELLQANDSASVFRVDVAVDLKTLTEASAQVLAKFLDRHVVLKWRSPTATKQLVGSTVYWANGSRSRNFVGYEKRVRTIRLELRFFGSRSVRRAGLADPATLLHLSPRNILEHNLKLVFFTDRYRKNVIRRTVSADRKRHMKERLATPRAPTTELFLDRYRSRIPARVEHILGKIDMQDTRSAYCKTKADSFSLSDFLNIPEFLNWPNEPEQSSSFDGRCLQQTRKP